MNKKQIEDLINNTGDIGNSPDMFHPQHGWLRIDGETTEAGLKFFKEQLDKSEDYHDNTKDKKGNA